jgi:hypothetical protein
MAESKKMPEQDILTVRCPCCNELIPVRITIAGEGIDEHYIDIGGCNDRGNGVGFPDIEIDIGVDVMGLKFEGGLDEIIENMSPYTKKNLLEHYDYNKAHDIYTGEKSPEITLEKMREEVRNIEE